MLDVEQTTFFTHGFNPQCLMKHNQIHKLGCLHSDNNSRQWYASVEHFLCSLKDPECNLAQHNIADISSERAVTLKVIDIKMAMTLKLIIFQRYLR